MRSIDRDVFILEIYRYRTAVIVCTFLNIDIRRAGGAAAAFDAYIIIIIIIVLILIKHNTYQTQHVIRSCIDVYARTVGFFLNEVRRIN